MRYRLLASYQGAPYEVGVGPVESDVVLFAACPPPEDLQFEPATGHWRKRVERSEVQTLHESRPVGKFRGERCIVLDDLGDRLHIVYLGHDALRAEQLGYWEVDRGVFELITPRHEVTEIVEQRLPFPSRSAPPTGQQALAALVPGDPGYPAGAFPVPAAGAGLRAEHSDPSPHDQGRNGFAPGIIPGATSGTGEHRYPGPARNGSGGGYPHDALPPPGTALPPPGTALPPPGTPPQARSPEISLPPVTEAPLPLEAEARRASAARRGHKGRQDRPPAPPATGPVPVQPATGPVPVPVQPATGPIPVQPPAPAPHAAPAQQVTQAPVAQGPQAALAPQAPAAATGAATGAAVQQPALPHQPQANAPGQGTPPLQPQGGPPLPPPGSSVSISEPPAPVRVVPDAAPGSVPSWTPHAQVPVPVPAPQEAPVPAPHAQQAVQQPPQAASEQPVQQAQLVQQAQHAQPGPAVAFADPAAAVSFADPVPPVPGTAVPASGVPGDPQDAPPGAMARRRRATRRRMPTHSIFSELAAQAAIPEAAYAIGADVDGKMCLLRTDEGFEVFNSAAGARHEARVFGDEESAYFYLFGVLVADAVRTGDLVPRQ